MRRVLATAVLTLALSGSASAQPASHLLVIVGLAGDHENAELFHRWAVTLVDAARNKFGLRPESVVYLGEDPARDPSRISGRSTREAVAAAFERLAAIARPGDRIFIVLIGHGASATGGARFNLPGPDLTAEEFSALVARLAAFQVVFVNTASASGGFVGTLSGTNRIVITATRTDGERNQTRFGEFFAEALSTDEADADKDGRVSLLEAFEFAKRRVADSYKRDGQLLTEHAMLEDTGDGIATDAPGQPGVDGAVARSVFMTSGERVSDRLSTDADPELRALVAQRTAIEARIGQLRAAKEKMDVSDYERQLEQLAIELARTSRAIRERQKK
jgi:hypothetical protein